MRDSTVILTLLAGALLLPPASHAGDSGAMVARVSYISGDVSYQRGDDEGWNGLRVNTPLVTGDSFYAPDGGRAEVNLGSGIVIRVDGGTQIDLVNNSGDIAQLGLTSGSLDLRASDFPRSFTVEIDTPLGAVTILEPGQYRVDVTDGGAAYSVVRGSMSLALDGQELDVREGESLQLEDTDPPTYGYDRIAASTPFQTWADDRESRWQRSSSGRYVNHDVVGYEDLDDHGTWRDNRDYGRVWVPTGMSQGWAPYQSGRWIWQDPYGWTWVSNESWGWAPYHYGRWVRADNDWCWVPPPPRGYRGPSVGFNIQAVYAPALVGFVGGRNWGLSLSIGGPAIGWVPLAPRESYYYPWQSAPRVTNNYTNITVNNAVTIVNYNTFATGTVRPIRLTPAQIQGAPAIGFTAVGVVPDRGSLVVAGEGSGGSRAIPRARTGRPLVARLVPPPRPRQFTQKVVEIERTGRPISAPAVNAGVVGKPFTRGARTPDGVEAVSALAPGQRKKLSPRRGAEVRAAKTIERDIAPPSPAVSRGRQERESAPAEAYSRPQAPIAPTVAPPAIKPEAAPAPGNRRGNPRRVPPPVTTPTEPASAEARPAPATEAVAPAPDSRRGNRRRMPVPVTTPTPTEPARAAARPAPATEAVAPAPGNRKAREPQPVPKRNKKKSKGKNAPEPPPEPVPDPSSKDGK